MRDGKVIVERKPVADLLASFRDGRWQDQLPRLTQAGLPILLIEGRIRTRRDGSLIVAGRNRQWTLDDLDGLLLVGQFAGAPSGHEPARSRTGSPSSG